MYENVQNFVNTSCFSYEKLIIIISSTKTCKISLNQNIAAASSSSPASSIHSPLERESYLRKEQKYQNQETFGNVDQSYQNASTFEQNSNIINNNNGESFHPKPATKSMTIPDADISIKSQERMKNFEDSQTPCADNFVETSKSLEDSNSNNLKSQTYFSDKNINQITTRSATQKNNFNNNADETYDVPLGE